MTVSGAITFDARGRVHQRGQPVFDNTPATSFINNVPMKNPTTLGYDILDRPISTETPDGALTTIAYGFDTLDGTTRRATTVRDPNVNAGGGLPGEPQETFSDVRGSVLAVQQQNHLGTAGLTTLLTRYAYDPLEELLAVTDAKGNVTSAQYDSLGRMVALTSPDAGLTTYSYDLSGNLAVRQTAKLRASSQSIRYEYDFNRLRQITYPTSTPVVYKYGDSSEQGDVFFNRAGRLKEEDSEAGTKTYQYDDLGDVVEQHWSLNSIAHDKTVEQDIGYDYDAFGRLLQIHFPDAELVSYGYDAGGNVTSAVGVDSQANTTPYVLQVGYDEFEQRTRLVSGNGVQTKYAYDLLTRRLSQINASTTARQFQAMRYQYDPSGNVDQIQNLAPFDDKMKGQVLVGPMTQNFTYDDLYQLKTADGLYQESSKQQFNYGLSLTYDAIGNILTKQQTSNQVALNNGNKVTPQQGQTYSSTYNYTGPRPHAPTEVDETPLSPSKPLARTLSYDPSGNQTGWSTQTDTRTVAWNEEDRITSVTDNGSNDMQALYDGAGDRAVRLHDAGGEAETFYFGPNLTSRDGAAPSKHVFLGTQRVASKEAPANKGNQPPSVFYFHDDHLGSTNFLTDSTQNLASHEEYFPTGELWRDETSDPLHVQTPYLFTGKELDVATGLYYFGARYYDPHLGIWGSPDPALRGFLVKPQDGVWNPLRLSLYGYVLNNPVRYRDPRGFEEFPKAGAEQIIADLKRYDTALHAWGQAIRKADEMAYRWGAARAAGASDPYAEAFPADKPEYAGLIAGARYNLWSKSHHREVAGLLYTMNGRSYATRGVAGESDKSSNPFLARGEVPAGARVVGWWHTHGSGGRSGGFGQMGDKEVFSTIENRGPNSDIGRLHETAVAFGEPNAVATLTTPTGQSLYQHTWETTPSSLTVTQDVQHYWIPVSPSGPSWPAIANPPPPSSPF